ILHPPGIGFVNRHGFETFIAISQAAATVILRRPPKAGLEGWLRVACGHPSRLAQVGEHLRMTNHVLIVGYSVTANACTEKQPCGSDQAASGVKPEPRASAPKDSNAYL